MALLRLWPCGNLNVAAGTAFPTPTLIATPRALGRSRAITGLRMTPGTSEVDPDRPTSAERLIEA